MCEYSGRLIAWLDRELPDEEATNVAWHLGQCAECRQAVRAYEEVSGAFLACYEARCARKAAHRPIAGERVGLDDGRLGRRRGFGGTPARPAQNRAAHDPCAVPAARAANRIRKAGGAGADTACLFQAQPSSRIG